MLNKLLLLLTLCCGLAMVSCNDSPESLINDPNNSLSDFAAYYIELLSSENSNESIDYYFGSDALKHLSGENIKRVVNSPDVILSGSPREMILSVAKALKDNNGRGYTDVLELPHQAIQKIISEILVSPRVKKPQQDKLMEEIALTKEAQKKIDEMAENDDSSFARKFYIPKRRYNIQDTPAEWLEEELTHSGWRFQDYGKMMQRNISKYRGISDVKYKNNKLSIEWEVEATEDNFNTGIFFKDQLIYNLYIEQIVDILSVVKSFQNTHLVQQLVLKGVYKKRFEDKWGEKKVLDIPVLTAAYSKNTLDKLYTRWDEGASVNIKAIADSWYWRLDKYVN